MIRRLSARLREPASDSEALQRERILGLCAKAVYGKRLFLNKTLSAEMLAAEVGTNRAYLSRALASRGGFNSYINSFRVRYAACLVSDIRTCRLKISEIAELSGFTSERAMNHYLMKTYGIRARAFRYKVLASAQAKNLSTSFTASGRANTATRS